MNPSKLISPQKNHNYGSILIKNTKGTAFETGQAQLRQNMTYRFEKEAGSVGLSSSKKSILKKTNLEDIDTNPKKKDVAFNTNQNNHPLKVNSNENVLDGLFLMARTRSKSNDGERSHRSFLTGQYESKVTKNFSVGKTQDGTAILLSEDFSAIEVPLPILPPDIRKGNILTFTIERSVIEEESRKDGIIRAQRELLGDRSLFDEYMNKVEYFQKIKMEVLQATKENYVDIQRIIDEIFLNIEDGSFLDKSGFIDDDRIILRPENIVEAKLGRNDVSTINALGSRK